MKDVKLKFLGLGYLDCFQVDIYIYDRFDSIIYEGRTFNGEVNVCLKEGDSYKILVKNGYNLFYIIFYVGNDDSYTFNFSCINNITFMLVDYYYDNLPIERGELWLKM